MLYTVDHSQQTGLSDQSEQIRLSEKGFRETKMLDAQVTYKLLPKDQRTVYNVNTNTSIGIQFRFHWLMSLIADKTTSDLKFILFLAHFIFSSKRNFTHF